MAIIVTLDHTDGEKYYLRGTVWTLTRNRAVEHETIEEAKAALANRYTVLGGAGTARRILKAEEDRTELENADPNRDLKGNWIGTVRNENGWTA